MRKAWVWVGQAALAAVVAWFVVRRLSGHWGELSTVPASLRLRVLPILMSVAAVLGAYALLIAAWRSVLGGWGAELPYRSAARIWCVSNLGRYIPGKVWSVAGLAVLAQREGAPGWAAAGSAIAMQALALGTGAVIVAVTLPGSPTVPAVLVAGVVAIALVSVLTSGTATAVVGRLTRGRLSLTPLPPFTVVTGGLATMAAWVLYGLALWMLAGGMVTTSGPPIGTAIGVFAGAYIVGLIAIFAPGGVGVREAVLAALLEPAMGAGPAVALSVGSRLLLTSTEVLAAVGAVSIAPRRRSPNGSASMGKADT